MVKDGAGHASDHWFLMQSWCPIQDQAADEVIDVESVNPLRFLSRLSIFGASTADASFDEMWRDTVATDVLFHAIKAEPAPVRTTIVSETASLLTSITKQYGSWPKSISHLALGVLMLYR